VVNYCCVYLCFIIKLNYLQFDSPFDLGEIVSEFSFRRPCEVMRSIIGASALSFWLSFWTRVCLLSQVSSAELQIKPVFDSRLTGEAGAPVWSEERLNPPLPMTGALVPDRPLSKPETAGSSDERLSEPYKGRVTLFREHAPFIYFIFILTASVKPDVVRLRIKPGACRSASGPTVTDQAEYSNRRVTLTDGGGGPSASRGDPSVCRWNTDARDREPDIPSFIRLGYP